MALSDKKRMNAPDREMLHLLFAVKRVLTYYEDSLEKLCRRAPGKIDFLKEASRNVELVIDDLLDTVPKEQLYTIKAEQDSQTIHVATRNAGQRPKDHWLITYDDLAVLASYAADVRCFSCLDHGGPCKLRSIFKEIPVQIVDRLVVPCWKEDE